MSACEGPSGPLADVPSEKFVKFFTRKTRRVGEEAALKGPCGASQGLNGLLCACRHRASAAGGESADDGARMAVRAVHAALTTVRPARRFPCRGMTYVT